MECSYGPNMNANSENYNYFSHDAKVSYVVHYFVYAQFCAKIMKKSENSLNSLFFLFF